MRLKIVYNLSLIQAAQVIQDRQDAFQSDMSPEEIREFGKKHKLPKNVIYKMLEKYHYLKFYKCKDILDDGNITDKEIDSLKEAVGRDLKNILHLPLVDLIHQQ